MNAPDLSLRNLINRDAGCLGPIVVLVRVRVEGITQVEHYPAAIATALLLSDPLNGVEYARGWILWKSCPSWDWDQSA